VYCLSTRLVRGIAHPHVDRNYFNYSTIIIKKLGFEGNTAVFTRLGKASYTNIVRLLEGFYNKSIIYFVYNYSRFAFDLSQVASTLSVNFTEQGLASHL
jgi:hypothetical protein